MIDRHPFWRSRALFVTGFALAALLLVVSSAAAQELPPGTNTICPVLTDEPVDPSIFADYEGRRIYFCCQRCKKQFLADPGAYLANLPSVATDADPAAHGGGRSTRAAVDPASLSTGVRLWRFAGRFHPAAVHFPIALLVVATLFQFLGGGRKEGTLTRASVALALLGAAGAVFAASLGWSAAAFSNYPGEMGRVLETHRWLGLATAGTAVAAAIAGALSLSRGGGWPFLFRLLLLAASVLVLTTGFFGGSLIYGLDHYRW